MEIGGYTLASPWFLLLLLVLPLMWWWDNKAQGNTKTIISFPHVGSLTDISSIKTLLLRWLPIFRYLSLGFLTLALARPQQILKEENINAEGIDIVMALDISGSMSERDFYPNRLEASKKIAAKFVDKRSDDRIGLVVFAEESFTFSPLTTDHMTLKNFMSDIDFGIIGEGGTAIGLGLASSINCLRDSESKSKIIVFLTDGVDYGRGYISPKTAIEIAKKFDIKVYTIGVGKQTHRMTFRGREKLLDEELLMEIASQTGGEYYRAKNEVDLNKIYDEIDILEKTEFEFSTFTRYTELFRQFLLAGLIFLLLEFILKNTLLRTLP